MGRENMYGMILSQMVALYHQKGDFEISTDGDLFKVKLCFDMIDQEV